MNQSIDHWDQNNRCHWKTYC